MLAARAVSARSSHWQDVAPPDPAAILALAESIIRERVAPGGERAVALSLEDVRRLLVGWLKEMELDPRLESLLRTLQIEEGGHAALALRARRMHERKLARAMTKLVDVERSGPVAEAIPALVGASLPVVPYVPAGAMLARERAKLVARDGDPMHVAVVADGLAHVHGVGQTLAQLRERGLRGHGVDLIGTDELATAIRGISRRQALLQRLITGALLAVRERTWERSLAELAAGYAKARGDAAAAPSGTPLSPDPGMRQAA